MTRLISIEWLKMRTIRSPWFLLLGAIALVIAGVSGVGRSGTALAESGTVARAASHVGLVSMLSLVIGILIVAGEYRHKTITDTFLTTPRRTLIIAAKLVVAAGMGLLFGLVSAAVALLMIVMWWNAKGIAIDFSRPLLWQTLLGGMAWNVLFAAIGVGIGALVRNLTAAIAIALAWIAVVEGVVGQVVGDLARWLPFASGSALGEGPTLGSYTPISQWQGVVALIIYAGIFVMVALATSVRSDVT